MANGPNMPDPVEPPGIIKNLGTWASWGKNFLIPVVGTPLTLLLGINVDWAIAALFAISLGIYWGFRFATRGVSAATQNSKAIVLQTKIPTALEREAVAGQLDSLELRYRIAVWIAFVVVVGVIASVGGYFGFRYWVTKEPSKVALEPVVRFSPVANKDWLIRVPFLEAVIGHLEEEGKAASQKSQIYLIKTMPMGHPTPPFDLKMGFEEEAYDLTGYAFRRRSDAKGDQYEAVPISFGSPNEFTLDVPRCDNGDQILVVARISLNKASQFPSKLEDRIKVDVKPKEKK